MKVAITGASGFLGGALAGAYHERGDEVVALVRSTSDTSFLESIGANLIDGPLIEPESFDRLLDGVDLAIHCAAMATDFGPWEQFQAINVDSTQLFLESCLKNEIARAIYISSVAVYGNGKHHRGTDEEAPYETIIVDNYTRSKIMAERIGNEFIQQRNLPLTIIRPGYIWGEGDRAIMPKLIDAIKKNLVAVVDGGRNVMNLTHIDNLVGGIMLAGEKEIAIGRVYNITDGSKVTTRHFIEDLLEIIGVEYKIRSYPYVPAYVVAYLLEIYSRLRRYKVMPPITRYTVRVGEFDQIFDISRAIYELGYEPKISYKEGMAGMIRYVRRLYYGQK
jgi:2-alkyl-3-oxoalkanoate reductase